MPVRQFYKFSPSGNDTLLILDDDFARTAEICRDALAVVVAEQAALVDPAARSARMAGGEFCVNACRALGALFRLLNLPPDEILGDRSFYQISMSGLQTPATLEVSGQSPLWEVAVSFPAAAIARESRVDCEIVRLPGISHALIKTDVFPSKKDAMALAASLAPLFVGQPAYGLVFWRREGGLCEILPYVVVPGADTAMFENSCGSGSLALALTQDETTVAVRQPSGEILTAGADDERASIRGSVLILASGVLYMR